MKKLLVLAVLLAIGSAQALVYDWFEGYSDSNSSDWDYLNGGNYENWFDQTTYPTVLPGSGDNVQIDDQGPHGSPHTHFPIIGSDFGTVNQMFLGIAKRADGVSSFTVNSGGSLVSALTGVGWQAGTTGTIEMTSGYHGTAALYLGYVGHGIINLTGNALLDITANLAMAVGAAGGTGEINMNDTAMFRILGDASATGWENTLIVAMDAPQELIAVNFNGTETEYTVIPEPATLGLLAILGLAFLRRK